MRHVHYLLADDGQLTHSWWSVQPGIQQEESLELAIAGATGISGGTAHTVPKLLMPSRIGGSSLAGLQELQRLDDAALEGTPCLRLQGCHPPVDAAQLEEQRREWQRLTGQTSAPPRHEPLVLWLEHGSLRRLEQRSHHAGFVVESVTTYMLQGLPPVDAAALAFDPPAA